MSSRQSLTPRQRQAYDVIAARIAATGVAPSHRELADALGLKAEPAAFDLYKRLEQRGWIVRQKGRARAVRLVPDPRPAPTPVPLSPAQAAELRALALAEHRAKVGPGSAGGPLRAPCPCGMPQSGYGSVLCTLLRHVAVRAPETHVTPEAAHA